MLMGIDPCAFTWPYIADCRSVTPDFEGVNCSANVLLTSRESHGELGLAYFVDPLVALDRAL